MLEVPEHSLRVQKQALLELAAFQNDEKAADDEWQEKVKDALKLTSALNPSSEDVAELLNKDIFMVTPGPGQRLGKVPRRLKGSNRTEFAIVDRYDLSALFPDLPVLDFTVAETRQCQNVFVALGLAGRYLSALAKETTMVGYDGKYNSSLTKSFRLRAFAIFRYA